MMVTDKDETRLVINSVLDNHAVLKQVLNNIEQVVWVQDISTDHFIYVSPAFNTLWGRPPEDLYTKAFIQKIASR
jgi:PAS domain-containing protein